MKTSRILSIILFALVTLTCSAQKLFTDLASMPGVTSVYIGKAMLKMNSDMVDTYNVNGTIDLSALVNELSSIEIIVCEDPTNFPQIKQKTQSVLGKYDREIFSEVSEDDQTVEISGVPDNDDQTYSMILITVNTSDELTYIIMHGNISLDTLAAALN